MAFDPSLPPTGQVNNGDPQGAREIGSPCESFWDTEAVPKKNVKVLAKDADTIILEGRTLASVREITTEMGAKINWNPATKTGTIIYGDTEIMYTVGKNELLINGTSVIMDVPTKLIANRSFIPVRFIAESLDDYVAFEGL